MRLSLSTRPPYNRDRRGRTDPIEALVYTCWAVLDAIQDFIAGSTAEPWPGTTIMPNPNARLDGATVNLWFEYSDNTPPLELPPISVDGDDQ